MNATQLALRLALSQAYTNSKIIWTIYFAVFLITGIVIEATTSEYWGHMLGSAVIVTSLVAYLLVLKGTENEFWRTYKQIETIGEGPEHTEKINAVLEKINP